MRRVVRSLPWAATSKGTPRASHSAAMGKASRQVAHTTAPWGFSIDAARIPSHSPAMLRQDRPATRWTV